MAGDGMKRLGDGVGDAREEVGIHSERRLYRAVLQELGLDVEGGCTDVICARAREAGGGVGRGIAGGGGLRRAAGGLRREK